MRKIIVDKKYNEKKLNSFILDKFPALSSNILFKALRQKDIRINGEKVKENVIIHSGDEITIYITDLLLAGISKLDVIFEDENIIVFNKPSGISINSTESSVITFNELVKSQYGNDVEPCHRLDQNTTGLIIYAKNQISLNILKNKFENHEIEKYYQAQVLGKFKKKNEILEAYLFKDSKKSLVYISDVPKKGYVKIITEYTVLFENTDNTSIIEICLHTGKTHQIRAHLAHIGHPIIGDGKYGINEINKKFNKSTQMLCSYKLKFNFSSPSDILEYLNKKEIQIKPDLF